VVVALAGEGVADAVAAKYDGVMEFVVPVGGSAVVDAMTEDAGATENVDTGIGSATDASETAAASATVGHTVVATTVGEVGVTGATDAAENGTVVSSTMDAGGADAAAVD
jgi:hypothetical protein